MSILSRVISEPRLINRGGVVISNPLSVVNKAQREQLVSILPRNIPPPAILSAGSPDVTFELPHGSVDELDMLYFQFTLTNNNATNMAAPQDGYSLLTHIELRCNNEAAHDLYGDALRKVILLTTSSDKASNALLAANLNPNSMDPNYTIAAGASLDYSVPIPSVLNVAQVPMWRREMNWSITFTFRQGANCLVSTSVATVADLTLNQCKLVLDGIQFSEEVRAAYDKELNNSGKIYFKYLEGTATSLALSSVTSGVTTQANLQQSGWLAFALLDLQDASAANQSATYSPALLNSVELLSNSKVISHQLGDGGFKQAFMRQWSASHWTSPELFRTLNTMAICFSDNPGAALATGSNYGAHYLTGQTESIRVNPGATLANALIRFYGFYQAYMSIDFRTGQYEIARQPAY